MEDEKQLTTGKRGLATSAASFYGQTVPKYRAQVITHTLLGFLHDGHHRFIKYLLVGSAVAFIAILGTQRLLVYQVRARMNEAGRFEDSVRRAIEHDARFANITFEGVSWSGFGHPVSCPP